ncbi:hypothetical protein AB0D11_44610 [Streptomyces monashensis]|uniref:hypothetical protein n=1 Tax=Streptomyces monashensis TaxID=1678012 RepID=UPI0033F17EAE
MAELSVIVFPPSASGGRRVCIGERAVGTAYSLRDLTVLLRDAGVECGDEVDVADCDVIEWHGGGPEIWAGR